jgi:hypothetical protein
VEYQPSNVTFGLFPPLPGRVPKSGRREAHAARARAALTDWIDRGFASIEVSETSNDTLEAQNEFSETSNVDAGPFPGTSSEALAPAGRTGESVVVDPAVNR